MNWFWVANIVCGCFNSIHIFDGALCDNFLSLNCGMLSFIKTANCCTTFKTLFRAFIVLKCTQSQYMSSIFKRNHFDKSYFWLDMDFERVLFAAGIIRRGNSALNHRLAVRPGAGRDTSQAFGTGSDHESGSPKTYTFVQCIGTTIQHSNISLRMYIKSVTWA